MVHVSVPMYQNKEVEDINDIVVTDNIIHEKPLQWYQLWVLSAYGLWFLLDLGIPS